VSKDEKLESSAPDESGSEVSAEVSANDQKEKPSVEEENAPEQSVEAAATEVEVPADAVVATTADPDNGMKWYVVHTYSGYEQKARLALKERIKQQKMDPMFGDVLIPSENVIELVRGEKKTTSRKFFPGYVLVKMILTDATWHLVKSTPKITGFVGNALTPPAVPEEEVLRITNQMAEGTLKPRPKVQFEEGESVRVVDGPFVNFNGVVEEVKPDKGKLRVLVSIFGRSTPVELDFVQVEKN
jgi:transcription termination/antitermination protein NusG